MTKRIPKNAGFTLIEMMIAVFASLIIGLAILTVFNVQHNQTIVQQGIGEMDSNVRIALTLMDKGVNAAGYQFREDNGVTALNPRLAIMQWNNVAGGNPTAVIDTGGNNWPTTPTGLPNVKANTDAFAVTTPFSLPNPANGNAVESVCANASAQVTTPPTGYGDTVTFDVCNPAGFASGCILLNNFFVADPSWWGTINGSSTEPALLVQFPTAGGGFQNQTLSISNITNAGCPGGISFVGTGQGLQITPQTNSQSPAWVAPVGTLATISLVSSYLYYLSDNNQLIRVPAGQTQATHASIPGGVTLIDDIEDLQLQFKDNNGFVAESIDDITFGLDGGLDPDPDGFDNTQRIAAIRIGLVGRTQLSEGLSKSAVLKPQQLFDHNPGGPVDKYHRRVVMRTSSADNLRF